MWYINLFATKTQEGAIRIGIEQISLRSNSSENSKFNPGYFRKNVQEIVIDQIGENKREWVKEQLARQEVRAFLSGFESKDLINSSLVYYTFPSDEFLQIHLLRAIGFFIKGDQFDAVFVSEGSFVEQVGPSDFAALRQIIEAQNPQSSNDFDYLEGLAYKLLAHHSTDTSNSALRYYQFAQAHQQPANECHLARNRFLMDHWEQLPPEVKQQKFALPLYDVFQQAKNLLSAEEYTKLNEEVILDAKNALIIPCLGQKAHDGHGFRCNYTEYAFIKGISLSLINGQLVFNLDTNKGYQDYYAPGKNNYDVFEEEMLALAKYNGWAFEKNDFHLHMAFTRECSTRLLHMGIVGAPATPAPAPTNVQSYLSQMFFATGIADAIETFQYYFGRDY